MCRYGVFLLVDYYAKNIGGVLYKLMGHGTFFGKGDYAVFGESKGDTI